MKSALVVDSSWAGGRSGATHSPNTQTMSLLPPFVTVDSEASEELFTYHALYPPPAIKRTPEYAARKFASGQPRLVPSVTVIDGVLVEVVDKKPVFTPEALELIARRRRVPGVAVVDGALVEVFDAPAAACHASDEDESAPGTPRCLEEEVFFDTPSQSPRNDMPPPAPRRLANVKRRAIPGARRRELADLFGVRAPVRPSRMPKVAIGKKRQRAVATRQREVEYLIEARGFERVSRRRKRTAVNRRK
jgi:hypothetical protein